MDTYKYLGVIFDEKLTWKPQIETITNKLASVCGMFFRVRHCMDQHALNIIFHSLVLSRITYGLISWGSACTTNLHPLIVILNRIIRCLNFCPRNLRVPLCQLYKKNKILQLSDLYKSEIAKFMYKFNKNKLLPNFSQYCASLDCIHDYHTRQKTSSSLFLPRMLTKMGQKALLFKGVQIWQNIPSTIKQQKSLQLFVKSLRTVILNSY